MYGKKLGDLTVGDAAKLAFLWYCFKPALKKIEEEFFGGILNTPTMMRIEAKNRVSRMKRDEERQKRWEEAIKSVEEADG